MDERVRFLRREGVEEPVQHSSERVPIISGRRPRSRRTIPGRRTSAGHRAMHSEERPPSLRRAFKCLDSGVPGAIEYLPERAAYVTSCSTIRSDYGRLASTTSGEENDACSDADRLAKHGRRSGSDG